jgi:flavin-dependent dehydrogenase
VPAGTWAAPARLLADCLAADALLSSRFARARPDGPARVIGPLAVQAAHPGGPGVLLAGDAVGFVDPMTGDGIHLALQTAEEAARVTGLVLEGEVTPRAAHRAYAAAVGRRLGLKRQFNRVLRGLVGSPRAVRAAAVAARICPSAFEAVIRYAGDTGEAGR